MSELGTLLEIMKKLQLVDELKIKVENLEKSVESLKKTNSEQMSMILSNSVSDNSKIKIEAADLAIMEFKQNPPKRGMSR
jgi:chaperonin cofactor prefoldin